MSLAIGSDYAVVDGLQTITYFVKTGETNPFPNGVSIPNVLQRVTIKTLSSGPTMMTLTVATFHLWANQTNGIVPKANDKLTDAAGTSWVVKQVNDESLDTRFKLTAEKVK